MHYLISVSLEVSQKQLCNYLGWIQHGFILITWFLTHHAHCVPCIIITIIIMNSLWLYWIILRLGNSAWNFWVFLGVLETIVGLLLWWVPNKRAKRWWWWWWWFRVLIGVFSTFSIATFWIIAPIRKTKKLLNNLRVNFWSRAFVCFVGSSRTFWGFYFCLHSIVPAT